MIVFSCVAIGFVVVATLTGPNDDYLFSVCDRFCTRLAELNTNRAEESSVLAVSALTVLRARCKPQPQPRG
jgi:hypothetical protein